MTWEDIVRKLTSRKFWLALALFVSGIVTACGGTESKAQLISGLIMQGAAVIAYIIGEGLVDAKPVVQVEDFFVDSNDIEEE